MREEDTRKAFGTRLKALRKQQSLTQKALAERIGVQFAQLNKYEGGLHVPPIEKLVLLADLLETTVDYLLTGERDQRPQLRNAGLLERFEALEKLPAPDRETVITLIDAMIVKHNVETAVAPFGKAAR